MWWVYLCRCADDSLYAGVAVDVGWRIQTHNIGKYGAKYTRSRRPVVFAYAEGPYTQGDALRRERIIKTMSRANKLKLIEQSGIKPTEAENAPS